MKLKHIVFMMLGFSVVLYASGTVMPKEVKQKVSSGVNAEKTGGVEKAKLAKNDLPEMDKKDLNGIIVYGTGVLIGVLLIVVSAVYILSIRAALRREALILRQQETIMGLMLKQQQVLVQGHAMVHLAAGIPEGTMITPRILLNDPNPRARAKGIEIVDAQFIKENEDSEVAQKLLQDFLGDPNNRVRANAVKSLHRYHPEEAVKVAADMLESNDKWMRVSAVWVLGEFAGDVKAAELLLRYKGETDTHLKGRLLKSLSKILNADKKLPADIAERVSNALADLVK